MNKKGIVAIGTIFVMLLAMPFSSTVIVSAITADQIYENIEEVPTKDVGLVLGAAAYGSRLSDVLRDRVDTGIELYEAEKISTIIMTGAENEVVAMANYATEHGIPATSIIEDPKGINTLASVTNIAGSEQSVTIVTQKYHLPRALFIANHLGIEAVGITADKSKYTKIFEFKKREIFATTKAMLDLFLKK